VREREREILKLSVACFNCNFNELLLTATTSLIEVNKFVSL